MFVFNPNLADNQGGFLLEFISCLWLALTSDFHEE
jgi:hypothetical protein